MSICGLYIFLFFVIVNGIIGLHGSFSSISLPSIESPESIEAKKAAATTAVPEPEFAKGAPEPAPVRMLDSTAASPLIQTKIHITKGKSQVSYDLKNTVDPNLNCTGPRNRSAVCNDVSAASSKAGDLYLKPHFTRRSLVFIEFAHSFTKIINWTKIKRCSIAH